MGLYLGNQILPGNVYLGNQQLGVIYQGTNSIVTSSATNFTPANIPNVLYWFTSNKGVTISGSNITQWTDQISGSISLELSGSINAPKYNSSDPVVNNLPSIEFNTGATKGQGLYKYLTASPFTTASSVTIIETIIPSTRNVLELQVSSGLLGNRNPSGGFEFIMANGNTALTSSHTLTIFSSSPGGGLAQYTGNPITSGSLIWRAAIYDATPINEKFYINTASLPELTNFINNAMKPQVSLGFGVYSPLGDFYSEGKIVDLVYVNGVVSESDLQKYADYVATKF